ncbi:MAG: hypothetical protein M3011_13265 [Actinomycetota bacterium]|nr:hypothetical protein [Actinomycetota bacterium]
MGLAGAARRRPGLAVAISYVVVGTVALAPSIRPGRTLVATDLLTIVSPYSRLPGAVAGHNPLLSDIAYQLYPWFQFVGRALHQGHFPQWNPAVLGGLAVTPNGFVSLYYPPTWLAAVFSPFVAYNLFVLFHFVLGALGTYAFSRVLGARRAAAWVAGLLAFTAAFWVHWSLHLGQLGGFVWLPWALAAGHRLVDAPSPRRVAMLAGVYGLWWLGGNPQYVYDGTVVLGGYIVGYLVLLGVGNGRLAPRALLLRLAGVGGALVLGLGLAAPILLPTLGATNQILRTRETQAPNLGTPRSEVIRVLVPDATGSPPDNVLYASNDELRMDSPFVGVTGFLLAVAAISGRRQRARLLLLGGLIVVAVLAYTLPIHRLLFAVVPGYDHFRSVPYRWLSTVPALALPLAALGLDDLIDGVRRSRVALGVAGLVSVAAVAAWFAWQFTKAGAPHKFFAGRAAEAVALVIAVVVAGWMARRRPVVAVVLLAGCAVVEVGINTTRWFPSVNTAAAYPQVPAAAIAKERGGRVVRVGARTTFGPFAPDIPMVYGAADADGSVVFFPKDYDRYRRLVDDYGSLALDFNALPPLADGSLIATPLLDVLDVRTIVADPGVSVPSTYPVLDAGAPVVYARPSLGPAVVVPVARPVSPDGVWAAVADRGWDPSATSAVVGLDSPVAGGRGTVTGGAQGTDSERWVVDAPSGGFLRVSGRWDRGWTATMDGGSVPVLRADGIFRGVVVPPGRHRVTFSYQNPSEHRGRWLAAIGLLVLVGLAIAGRRRDRGFLSRNRRAVRANPDDPTPRPATLH